MLSIDQEAKNKLQFGFSPPPIKKPHKLDFDQSKSYSSSRKPPQPKPRIQLPKEPRNPSAEEEALINKFNVVKKRN